ncbi:MAG: hypothetical protein ACO1TE_03715 [Prosthecobacter sp.]
MNGKSTLKLAAVFAFLLTTTLLTSCGDMRRGKGMADAAILEFHKQFNGQKFKEIYAAAHPDFKAASTEADFMELLEAVQRKLGKHVKDTEGAWRVNSFNGRTTVSLSRDAEFEQGKGTESFNYVISGESCTLLGYNIHSKDMMMK